MDLEAKGRWAAYELQRDAIPGAVEMEWRGMGLDQAALQEENDRWSRELGDARRAWVEKTGSPPPDTPAQTSNWLQENLSEDELKRLSRTEKTGNLSTAKDSLERAADVPAVRDILDIRERESLLSKFGNNLIGMISPATGRIHPSFNVASTKSGRWSCSGPNLQQMPNNNTAPGFRKVFWAEKGYVLVGGDYSQMELRAAAEVSGDRTLQKVFEDGLDLHSLQAAAMAGVPLDQVTAEQRTRAKPVNFGSIYGMGANGLVATAWKSYGVVLKRREAELALEKFFTKFYRLKQWMREHANKCKSRRRIKIGAGRLFLSSWEPGGLRYTQCCNLPIQGVCADVMLLAVKKVHEGLNFAKIDGGLVANVHDELIVEVRKDQAIGAKGILQTAMTDAFTETFPVAPVGGLVDVKVGRTWGDIK
jgi:DNA polymerase I